MTSTRQIRQVAGLVSSRFSELNFQHIYDPRRAGQVVWPLPSVLAGVLCGLMSGCRSFAQLERLTADFGLGIRRLLGIQRRLPDTTARDVVCRIEPFAVRSCLHRLNLQGIRRKAYTAQGLPFGVVAMDGKWNAMPVWDKDYVQRHRHEEGERGMLRTVTSVLSSSAGRPCLDVCPIPHDTNEMGVFGQAFADLCDTYNAHFRLVTYDAGASSEANAQTVVDRGKDYLFALKNENHELFVLARQSLSDVAHQACSVDKVHRGMQTHRRVTLLDLEQNRHVYGEEKMWGHAKTLLKVEVFRMTAPSSPLPIVEEVETRFYISSLHAAQLQAEQWLEVVRRHWSVENNGHHTLDTAFAEDDKPWIETNPNGALVMLILRRIAYSLLTMFRSVTLRAQANRAMPWKALMRWVEITALKATDAIVQGLRQRKGITVCG